MSKELSQKQINYLLKKYEARRRNEGSSGRKLTHEDYVRQTDRNYKDGDRN